MEIYDVGTLVGFVLEYSHFICSANAMLIVDNKIEQKLNPALLLCHLKCSQKLNGVHFQIQVHRNTHKNMQLGLYTCKAALFPPPLIPQLLVSSWVLVYQDKISFPLEGLAQTQHLSLIKTLF